MWHWLKYQFFRITLGLVCLLFIAAGCGMVYAWWLALVWLYFHAWHHLGASVLLIVVTSYLLGTWCDDNV